MAAISPQPRRTVPPAWWSAGMALGTALGAAGCWMLLHVL